MLSKIENGAISPSLATLEALAGALNVSITALFARFEERRDCSFVPAGRGVLIERRGTKAGHQYELLGHSIAGDLVVEPYLIRLLAKAQPYPYFRHAGIEFIYMLTGAVDYRHADQVYPLRPGDSLLFDAAAVHGPERLVELPATFLSIITYSRVT
jgi:transcriptional regulator with XRE-family HTH domain